MNDRDQKNVYYNYCSPSRYLHETDFIENEAKNESKPDEALIIPANTKVPEEFFDSINMKALCSDGTQMEIELTADNIIDWIDKCDNEAALQFINAYLSVSPNNINMWDDE